MHLDLRAVAEPLYGPFRGGPEAGVLTVSSGHSVAYLTGAVAAGRENYYTGAVAAGEPPGRWYGAGAARLGLSGLVDHQDMTGLYEHFLDPRDPRFRTPSEWGGADRLGHAGRRYATAEDIYAGLLSAEPDTSPERREELRIEAGKRARRNVAFYDATFSVQKSVTVLHAAFESQRVAAERAGDDTAAEAWGAHVAAVEEAIWAGNNAGLDYLAEKAGYSRVGHHGGAAGRFVDAHDWTVASFFQHDNRNHDPQLHVHNAILNRVQGADGVWRTLDGRAVYAHRGAAAAVAERTMEEHLTKSLGVAFVTRPDGKAREVAGIGQNVLDLFSTRRRAITVKTAQLVETFRAMKGREPTALELDRLARTATFATRNAKSHEGETDAERLARWDAQLRAEVAGGLAEVADGVLAHRRGQPADPVWSPTAVIETALADLQAKKAAWTEPDLARAISDALPDHLGGLDNTQIQTVIDRLTSQALAGPVVQLTADAPGAATLPDELRLANGGSVYDRPGEKLYATTTHVRAERALRAAGIARGAPALDPESAAGFVDALRSQGIQLGADQAAAVAGILTSGARVETLVGPAGTGKSFVLGALAHAWTNPNLWNGQQRRVVGLATSQIATEVLAGEGLAAANIARWLAAQTRLDTDQARPEDAGWRLAAGDLVVVDESAMTDTAALTAIRERVEAAGAKLLLCGDHRQLAAVGAAGGMNLVLEHAATHELAEARRFTHGWEAAASLRLREGDEAVLREYRKRGRIIDAGTAEQAEDHAVGAYVADTLAGKHTLLVADTTEQAGRVAAKVRTELVRLGHVNEAGVGLGLDGGTAGVGDLVQARRNGWNLADRYGNRRGPINRETYRVAHLAVDGALVVNTLAAGDEEATETITLPAAYADDDLALGYASTAHAAQGMTVDTCHTLTGPATRPAALYVGMSRGRENNTCYVTTLPIPDDSPPGTVAEVERQDPVALLANGFETAREEQAALVEADHSTAAMSSIQTPGERFADVAEQAAAGRTATLLDRLVDTSALSPEQREQITTDDGLATLAHVLRQAEVAGHHPETVLRNAIESGSLAGCRSLASVLHHRITETVDLEPAGEHYRDWLPVVDDPAWAKHLHDLATAADTRRHDLAVQTAAEQPGWAVEAFGPVPDATADPDGRAGWEYRAGIVAAHRELTGHDEQTVALPGPPKRGQVEAYASWRAAWRALDRPEAQRAEAEMSDGQLRVRVRAYDREEAWAPHYVAPELSGTTQAETRHRHTAELRRAEAAAEVDAHERARLEQQATEAAELADTLARRRVQLQEADRVRGLWYAHTAETRNAARRAEAELSARGTAEDQLDDTGTTTDWLTHTHAADLAEDPHRQIVDDHELAHVAEQRETDTLTARPQRAAEAAGEEAPDDIRAETSTGSRPRPAADEEDWTKVATGDEVGQAIDRAQRALAELQARRVADEQHAAAERRTRQLTRWTADDRQAELDRTGREAAIDGR